MSNRVRYVDYGYDTPHSRRGRDNEYWYYVGSRTLKYVEREK